MRVRLKAKSRHGKNRISQHGDLWEVDETSHLKWKWRENSSADWKPAKRSKDSFLLRSIDCECSTCDKWGQDWRWVKRVNDPNFDIIEEIK